MFLLPRRIRQMLEKKKGNDDVRIFLRDEEAVTLVKKIAEEQGRSEEEVIADFTKAGWDQIREKSELEESWGALTRRERQVVALVCLGYRNYQIAETLVIAPETVKSHLQNIFYKFDLRSRGELRQALKGWDLAEWWERNRQE